MQSRFKASYWQSCNWQGGVENVQYATNHKRKGGGSARPVRSARSASHLEPGIFLAILPGTNFVVFQHLIRGLYHKLEKRQQPLITLSGRSTSLVSCIVSFNWLPRGSGFGAVLHRSLSTCSSSSLWEITGISYGNKSRPDAHSNQMGHTLPIRDSCP